MTKEKKSESTEATISLFNGRTGHFQVICQGERETFLPNTSRTFFESEAQHLLKYKGIVPTNSINKDKVDIAAILAENAKLKAEAENKGKEEKESKEKKEKDLNDKK